LGTGKHITFWEDKWIGEVSLKQKFPRLHTLSLNSDSTVCEVVEWVKNGNGVRTSWNLRYRRELFVWEKELEVELSILISTAQWRKELADEWLWEDGDLNCYTVRSGATMS